MKKILVAGATGYLGKNIVKELKRRNYWLRVLIRNENQKEIFNDLDIDDYFIGEITKPDSIKNICENIDFVFTSIGITRQKDGFEYMDVDYQGNKNLLEEAKKSEVELFQYVSAIGGETLRNLKIFEAKERFVDELKSSGLEYSIIRPSGFFSDMADFLNMAKRGKVYLFGSGNAQLNPIDGSDLARACADLLISKQKEILIGGPEILTQNEIGALALSAWERKIKIVHLPDWIRKIIIHLVRTFTSSKTYGPIEFFMTVMAIDNIGEKYGEKTLANFFNTQVVKEV
jgi:uncharacterized protein YbjT (DUF2867 family)